MASIDSADQQLAWNRAYDRLVEYLDTFALGDRAQASRLAVSLVDEAKEIHRRNPSTDPTTVTMRHVQKRVADWLASNLGEEGRPPAQIVATGCIALLLSEVFRSAPGDFLGAEPRGDLREAMRRTLLTTGPDLNVSSMTPRHLDYGPMLDFARQTWHRWETKSLALAIAFWVFVYFALYWSFTYFL
jgi:hypothetical protein